MQPVIVCRLMVYNCECVDLLLYILSWSFGFVDIVSSKVMLFLMRDNLSAY